jgi:1-acyl-sn-glycerol-3-phosphate acyltransferase
MSATVAAAELLDRPVQLRGSLLATVLLRAAGWRVRFDGLPSRQGVVIVYPHTSNWDFVVGLFAKWSIGIPVAFWGKASLFGLPVFGRWLRWVGGVPVDRSSPRGVVGEMAQRFDDAKAKDEFFWLALAPEGTRGWRPHWRSGFYRVALQAHVPLGMAYIDYVDRVVAVDRFLALSGDAAVDMTAIKTYLGHRRGRRPKLAAPVRLPPQQEDHAP